MKILITGKGSSGSWKIRGEQIGASIGATVVANACAETMRAHDVVVLVKRPTAQLLDAISSAKRPVIWDIVDSWPQPSGHNPWDRVDCMAWLRGAIKSINPVAVIAPTARMMEDIDGTLPCKWIPHHFRPGIEVNSIRDCARTVGYEGGPQFISSILLKLTIQCAEMGMAFRQSDGPHALAGFDIAVAMRGSYGYANLHWKSGVKLANALGSGTPIVCYPETGYKEIACGSEMWASSVDEIGHCINRLRSQETRAEISRRMIDASAKFSLESISSEYMKWMSALSF